MIQLDVYTQVQIKQVLWYKILSTDNCTRFCILIIIQTMFTRDSHGDAGMSVTMRPSKDMVIVMLVCLLLCDQVRTWLLSALGWVETVPG